MTRFRPIELRRVNEKRWRRGASIPIHPPASPPFPRMEEIAFIVLPIYTSRQVVIPSGDETCRVFSYIIVAFTNLYTESYRLGEGEGGKIIRESARSSDIYIYIFLFFPFLFFLFQVYLHAKHIFRFHRVTIALESSLSFVRPSSVQVSRCVG